MPSNVKLKLVNGMHKCKIMNNDPLTSFRLFDVGHSMWAYTVFIEQTDDTACYSSNNDVTGSEDIGHPVLILVLTLVTLNVPKINIMLPTGQWSLLQSHLQ